MSDPSDYEPRRDDDRPDSDSPYRGDRNYDRDRPRPPLPQSNGMATASLVLGILSLCGGITAIPGIACASMGLSRAKVRGKGHGVALAGLITSILGLVLVLPAILIGLMLPAVQKVREAAARMTSSNNLKQIGNGMQSYDSANGTLLPSAICDPKTGKKLLSWRVAILPYIEQEALYSKFKLDEPWDSPNNKPLIAMMPKNYTHPTRPGDQKEGLTPYKIFTGKNTCFNANGKPDGHPYPSNTNGLNSLTSSPRGTSNLILAIEGGDPVIWTKPDDFDYDPQQPLPDFKPVYLGTILAVMGDGRVISIRKGVRDSAMRASIDPNSTSLESLDQ